MELDEVLKCAADVPGRVVALTGAGVSAESGIPTFRGPEGYWRVGSRHYRPEDLATFEMFSRHPEAVWGWYLYRRGVCRAARPNPAHFALVELERAFGDGFALLSQNVDGLHFVAGNTPERTYLVHGNLHFMRCSRECRSDIVPVPESFGERPAGEPLTSAEQARLACPACGHWMRPHVLWFDETYDEPRYRFESALRAASSAALLLVVGTSGAAALPVIAARLASERGTPIVDVDPEPNPFATLAAASPVGAFVQGSAATVLPDLVARLRAVFGDRDPSAGA